MRNICNKCPAAYALNIYSESVPDEPSDEISATRIEMQKNEAAFAAEALNKAAGLVACSSIEKPTLELPETVPEVGSQELIDLVSQCPSFSAYLKERMG